MAQTKNALIRQRVIDRCLRSPKLYSVKDMMEKCNIALEQAGYSPVTSKVTILKDMDGIMADFPDAVIVKRKTCHTFFKHYTYLSQIITFRDVELEKLAPFCLALYKKLPYKKEGLPYDVLTESQLHSYKVQYQSTQNLSLESGDTAMKGKKPGQSKQPQEAVMDWLSNIIKVLNDTFGIDLTEEDKVDLAHLREKVMNDQELLSFFTPENSRDDVRTKFNEQVDSELLSFITTKLDLYNKLTEDRVNTMFKSTWFNELYDRMVSQVR